MNADNREAISRRIRALRAKTVENGCTEAEAIAAAEMLAALLRKYNMTVDEAELRASPFTRHTEAHDDWVGERLWKIAAAVAHLIDCRYWISPPGVYPIEINFFGFDHEVEVARYMLEIGAGAMRREQTRITAARYPRSVRRSHVTPFLDGMADRLHQRIRDLKLPQPPGTGLVVLHNSLVEQAMEDAGHKLKDRSARVSRALESGYLNGLIAGDRVALNRGLCGGDASRRLLR